MSRQKFVITAVAGVGAIGIGLFYRHNQSQTQSSSSSTQEQNNPPPQRRHSAHAKREFGLQGAAIGGNAIVGSTELSTKRNLSSSEQACKSPAPLEKLPSGGGGIAGGEGAGGSSARKMQFPTASSDRQSYGGEKPTPSNPNQSPTTEPGALEALRGVFTPGDDEAGVNPVDEAGFRDTRGASKMGTELPSKKRAPPT